MKTYKLALILILCVLQQGCGQQSNQVPDRMKTPFPTLDSELPLSPPPVPSTKKKSKENQKTEVKTPPVTKKKEIPKTSKTPKKGPKTNKKPKKIKRPSKKETPSKRENTKTIILHEVENIRYLRGGVLEKVAALPIGTRLKLSTKTKTVYHNFRTSKGNIERSTNGFFSHIKIDSVAKKDQIEFPQSRLDQLNSRPGGLFVTSSLVANLSNSSGVIKALSSKSAVEKDYLQYFTARGIPKYKNHSRYHQKRFGDKLNKKVNLKDLTAQEQVKWEKIYKKMVAIADRTTATPRKLLFIDSGNYKDDARLARQYSTEFEKSGKTQTIGAWSIAVTGTARRRGFANVPCAEFVSETIRQAYEHAGYSMNEDFKGKNRLIWSNTAAVVHLARALSESGWIPWDPTKYKPKLGAVGMKGRASWPGHAYLMAGHNGRFVVDNGSPKGRDLHKTSARIISMMYNHGVFFLPPGIIPERW